VNEEKTPSDICLFELSSVFMSAGGERFAACLNDPTIMGHSKESTVLSAVQRRRP
jgi:hypothetical protein